MMSLRDAEPRVWRLVEVSADTTLHKLHWTIQMAMGWTNSHVHQFIVGNDYYSQPEHDPDNEMGWDDEHSVRLRDLLWRPGATFAYEYDFGDSWDHDIAIEAIVPREKGVAFPTCIDGTGACPPEDCGGVARFAELVASMRDPGHPERANYLRWLGEAFDPDAFDLAEANERLRPLSRRSSLDRTR